MAGTRQRSGLPGHIEELGRSRMQATVLYGPHDVRVEDRPEPTIEEPTDAIISLPVTCICGSDLWPYRGISVFPAATPMGHEYCGIVEEVGRGVTSLRRGQFVIGSFFASDNSCPHCHHGIRAPASTRRRSVAPRRRDSACRSRTAHSSRHETYPMPTTSRACSRCPT